MTVLSSSRLLQRIAEDVIVTGWTLVTLLTTDQNIRQPDVDAIFR